jgi:hypothetical protein
VATPSDGHQRPGRQKTPVDQWFELFVYAPLGFALDARQLLPRFIDRGRSQVALARVVGRYAVQRGSARAEEYLGEDPAQLTTWLHALGLLPDDEAPGPSRVVDAEVIEIEIDDEAEAEDEGMDEGMDLAEVIEIEVDRIDVDTLAIPDYDTLSASQVVPRLGGLDAEELEAVRRYETAGRGRKTILNKIAQLATR